MRDVLFVPAEPGAWITDIHGHALPVIGWRVYASGVKIVPISPAGAMFSGPARPLAVEWPDGTLTDAGDHGRRYMDFMSWLQDEPLPTPVVRRPKAGPEGGPSDPPAVTVETEFPVPAWGNSDYNVVPNPGETCTLTDDGCLWLRFPLHDFVLMEDGSIEAGAYSDHYAWIPANSELGCELVRRGLVKGLADDAGAPCDPPAVTVEPSRTVAAVSGGGA